MASGVTSPVGTGSLYSGMNIVSYRPGRDRMPRQLPPLMSGPCHALARAAASASPHAADDRLGPRLLLQAAGDDDDALGLLALDDLRDSLGRLSRGDGQDEEIHALRQRRDVGHAAAALDLFRPGLDDVDPRAVEPLANQVVQDDVARVQLLGDADDGRRPRLEQLLELARAAATGGRATRRPPSLTRMSSATRPDGVTTSGLISHSAMSCGAKREASAMKRPTSVHHRLDARSSAPVRAGVRSPAGRRPAGRSPPRSRRSS